MVEFYLILVSNCLDIGDHHTIFLVQHKQTAIQHATATSSPSVYYGVYVHNDFWDFSTITSFEAEAGKPVAIVNTYQQWDPANNSPYLQGVCLLQHYTSGVGLSLYWPAA